MGRKVATSAALALLLYGCATMTKHTTNGIVNSWVGEPVEHIVEAWGVPQSEFQGAHSIVYEWGAPGATVGVAAVRGSGVFGVRQEMSCTRQMTVENGVIVSGNFHGNNCCFAAIAGYCATLANHISTVSQN
jgi:hypothetical protein